MAEEGEVAVGKVSVGHSLEEKPDGVGFVSTVSDPIGLFQACLTLSVRVKTKPGGAGLFTCLLFRLASCCISHNVGLADLS